MQDLKGYVLTIISTALICCVISELTKNTCAKKIIKRICGIFLTLMILQPYSRIDTSSIEQIVRFHVEDAKNASTRGAEIKSTALSQSIKEKLEAYILEKAEELNARISAEIQVNEAFVPIAIEIYGNVSPYCRKQLEEIIESDLGITKEKQQWIG